MRKLILAGLLLAAPLLAACNTIQGLGRDIETVGGTIEDAADDAKK